MTALGLFAAHIRASTDQCRIPDNRECAHSGQSWFGLAPPPRQIALAVPNRTGLCRAMWSTGRASAISLNPNQHELMYPWDLSEHGRPAGR